MLAPENDCPFSKEQLLLFKSHRTAWGGNLFQTGTIEIYGTMKALLLRTSSWMNWVSGKAIRSGEDLLSGSQEGEGEPPLAWVEAQDLGESDTRSS